MFKIALASHGSLCRGMLETAKLFTQDVSFIQIFPFYEEKRLYSGGSESSLSERESPEAFAAKLMAFDVISMDVFDTLLFRPFS